MLMGLERGRDVGRGNKAKGLWDEPDGEWAVDKLKSIVDSED